MNKAIICWYTKLYCLWRKAWRY